MIDRIQDRTSSFNIILEAIFRKQVTLYELIEEFGVSSSDIEQLTNSNISEIQSIIIDSIKTAAINNKKTYFSMREFEVIIRRIGLNQKRETLASIGGSFNISRERVRQIEQKCYRKLGSTFFAKTIEALIKQYLKKNCSSYFGLKIPEKDKLIRFETFEEAKEYAYKIPSSSIVRLDDDTGFLVKISKKKTEAIINSELNNTNNEELSEHQKKLHKDLKEFVSESFCVTSRVKNLILKEAENLGTIHDFITSKVTRYTVLKIEGLGRTSFKSLSDCIKIYLGDSISQEKSIEPIVTNYIPSPSIKNLDFDSYKNSVFYKYKPKEHEFFKMELFEEVRLINKKWTGSVSDLESIRDKNKKSGFLLNRGTPISLEEVLVFIDFYKSGESLSFMKYFFQRSLASIESAIDRIDRKRDMEFKNFTFLGGSIIQEKSIKPLEFNSNEPYYSSDYIPSQSIKNLDFDSYKNSVFYKYNPKEHEFFKMELLKEVRLLSSRWKGAVNDLELMRAKNKQNGFLLNRGTPISLEEVLVFIDLYKCNESLAYIENFFQRRLSSFESAIEKIVNNRDKEFTEYIF